MRNINFIAHFLLERILEIASSKFEIKSVNIQIPCLHPINIASLHNAALYHFLRQISTIENTSFANYTLLHNLVSNSNIPVLFQEQFYHFFMKLPISRPIFKSMTICYILKNQKNILEPKQKYFKNKKKMYQFFLFALKKSFFLLH